MMKTKPDKETLRRLYWDEHQSLRALGLRFDVDGATIRNWMLSYDIPRRDLSPGKKRSKQHSEAISDAQKRNFADGVRRYDGEHSPAWKGGPVTVKCGWCDEPVTVPRTYTKMVENTFCKGTDCLAKWRAREFSQRRYDKPHYGGQDVVCSYCDTKFRRDNSALRGRNRHFCSLACVHLSGRITLQCKNCGITFLRPKYRNKGQRRVFCTRVCKQEYLRGDEIYNFKGGYEPYYGKNWRTQRRKARKRDKHTCQHCSTHQSEFNRALDVHHIISFSEFGIERYIEANCLDNLISLCSSCHSKETANNFATPHRNSTIKRSR